MHEYTVIKHPRHKVLFVLAGLSVFLSSVISLLVNEAAVTFNLPVFIATFSISGFTLFGFFYWLFNNFLWKTKFFCKMMKFPNLSGKWVCTAISNNIKEKKQYNWGSVITITQCWDKILIVSKTTTSNSESQSVVGGINFVEGKGYEVSYHYNNTPNVTEKKLSKHEGFCVLCFSENLQTAEGYYFNNVKERASYGEMNLRKEVSNV